MAKGAQRLVCPCKLKVSGTRANSVTIICSKCNIKWYFKCVGLSGMSFNEVARYTKWSCPCCFTMPNNSEPDLDKLSLQVLWCILQQVELASTFFNTFFKLATTNFVAWQCLRWVVTHATTLFNLQCNNVALQAAAICGSYYFTLKIFNNADYVVERKNNWAKCDIESVKRMGGEYDILGPFLALMTTF